MEQRSTIKRSSGWHAAPGIAMLLQTENIRQPTGDSQLLPPRPVRKLGLRARTLTNEPPLAASTSSRCQLVQRQCWHPHSKALERKIGPLLAFASLLLVRDTQRVVGHRGAVEVQQRLRGRQAGGAEHHVAQPGRRQPLQVYISVEARSLSEFRCAADGNDSGGAWLAARDQSSLPSTNGSAS